MFTNNSKVRRLGKEPAPFASLFAHKNRTSDLLSAPIASPGHSVASRVERASRRAANRSQEE